MTHSPSRAVQRALTRLRGRVHVPTRWRQAILALVIATGITTILGPQVGPSSAATHTETLFRSSSVNAVTVARTTRPTELGMRFTVTTPGTITGIRYYGMPASRGVHTASLWAGQHSRLATVRLPASSKAGWRSATFSLGVRVVPGRTYVVSYYAPHGRYAVQKHGFSARITSGHISAPQAAAVYRVGKGGGFPNQRAGDSNYLVDVLFRPGRFHHHGTSSSPSPTPSPTPSLPATSPSATQTPTVAPTSPAPTTSAPPTSSAPPVSSAPPTSSAPPVSTTANAGWTLTPYSVGLAPFGLKCADLPVLDVSTWQNNTVPAGTTIYRKRITGAGTLYLQNGNITISQSCIQPKPNDIGQGSTALRTTGSGGQSLQGPVTIEDSEYDGSLLSDHDKAYIGFFNGVASFYRNYVHDSGSGLNTYGSYEKTGADVVVENNYVHRLIAYGDPSGNGNHQSAYTVRDFDTSVRADRQLIIRNNYFNCDGANATGALFIQPNGDDVSNVTISGNLLAGNGFTLRLEDDQGRFPGVTYHNIRAVNNRFSPTEYGATRLAGSGEGWTQWQDNYLYNSSATDGRGTSVSEP